MASSSSDTHTKSPDKGSDDEDDDFALTKVSTDLYLCTERRYNSWNVANIWIVQGTTMDLIIDTGIGLWDLPVFLIRKGIISSSGVGEGSKPFQAVATHVHFDHSGGLHQFPQFAIHEAEVAAIRTGDDYEACSMMFQKEIPSKWKSRDYKIRPANPTTILQDGHVFDLGDKQLTVMHLPGHSRGSIALFDEANGHLFSGDIVYDGMLFDYLPYSSVQDYITSFETLQELAPLVQRVLPGHNSIFDSTKLTEIAARYLKEAEAMCHGCTTCVRKAAIATILNGRNTKGAHVSRCCYNFVFCGLCLGG